MKTRNDDFSDKNHAEENNIASKFTFKTSDGKFYKLELDFSPASFMRIVASSCVRKPLPWEEYIKHNTEEEKKAYQGRNGHYIPAKNITQIIASMIEEAQEVRQ